MYVCTYVRKYVCTYVYTNKHLEGSASAASPKVDWRWVLWGDGTKQRIREESKVAKVQHEARDVRK